ncbi:MAG: hypothetical protein K2V38_19860, partial [Gemmataceae bacterium]|nr:hypothetical protein [Gemmataceae bacterium]
MPEPQPDQTPGWRQQQTKLPSLAKQNVQKLEGVVDVAETTQISTKTQKELFEEEEYEPRSLKQVATLVLLGLGLVAGIGFGLFY